jgi:uncharacterized lipoprotein YmbA
MMRNAAMPVALACAVLAGCGASAMSKFYTLSPAATAGAAPMPNVSVAVGPVTVPSAVDRPQFVVQVAPNRVEIDEFHRWAAPLEDGIARAVAGDLAVLLGTQSVAAGPVANFRAGFRVTIDVQRFDSAPGKGVVVDAIWAVHPAEAGRPIPGRTVAEVGVSGTTREELAAAHSAALATVSSEVAAAIRAHAGAKSPAAKAKSKR